jgi:putative transposon-encoded protein
MRKTVKIEMEGYEMLDKTAKESGNGAQVYVPKNWAGKRIKVVLLE